MQDETMPKTKHKTIALGFKNSSCSPTLLIRVFLFYKTHSQNQTILAKTNAQKHAFCHNLALGAFILQAIFQPKKPSSKNQR